MIAPPAAIPARPVRRRIAVSLLACAALLTSACAAGQHAQTVEQTPAIDAGGGAVGTMQLHAVAIAAPPNGPSYASGQNAALRLVIVNAGTSDDTLTGISSSVAKAATVATSASDKAALAETSASSGAVVSAVTFSPVTIPAGQSKSFGIQPDDSEIVLTGLTDTLFPAAQVPITFTFASAGAVTITVPVAVTAPPSSPMSVPPPSGASSQ